MLTLSEQHILINNYLPLAKKLAIQKKRQSGLLCNISMRELVSASYFGLVDAASRYNEEVGSFRRYAELRISGALQDYLRELGFGSKGSNSHGCQQMEFFDSTDNHCDGCRASNDVPIDRVFEEMVEGLDEKGRLLLRLRFVQEESLKVIGKMLGVSEGRVSQMISMYRDELLVQAA